VHARENLMRTPVKRQSEEAKTSGLLMVGLRGEEIIMELCRKEEINHPRSMEFLESGQETARCRYHA
jgi:hypothetical protein